MALIAALMIVLSSSPALESAKKHLAKGEASDVAFDLEGQTFSDAEKPEAAKVLAAASKSSLDAKDSVLALHCAQKAVKLAPKNAAALEAAARAAFAEEQFEAAEQYTESWLAMEPKNPQAHLLRAELASEAGEWTRVLSELQGLKLEGDAAAKAATLEQKAKAGKAEQETRLQGLKSFYERAAAEQKQKKEQPVAAYVAPVVKADVIVYGTSWCGYCKKTRNWLNAHSIPFIDKDVEKDDGAAEELAQKARDQGVRPRGVPVIDARGRLVLGFNADELEDALR